MPISPPQGRVPPREGVGEGGAAPPPPPPPPPPEPHEHEHAREGGGAAPPQAAAVEQLPGSSVLPAVRIVALGAPLPQEIGEIPVIALGTEAQDSPIIHVAEFDVHAFAAESLEESEKSTNTPFAVAFFAKMKQMLGELEEGPCQAPEAPTGAGPRDKKKTVLSWKFGDLPAQLKLPDRERKALIQVAGFRSEEGSTLEFLWSVASSQDAEQLRSYFKDGGWTIMRFHHDQSAAVVSATARKEKTARPAWKQRLIDNKREQNTLQAATPPIGPASRGSRPVFSIETQKGESFVLFRDSDLSAGRKFDPPVLAVAVRNMTHFGNPREPIPLDKLQRALGRLRAIRHECCIASLAKRPDALMELDAYQLFARGRALNELQGLGCTPAAPTEVEGLEELIQAIEGHFSDGIAAAHAAIKADKIGFWHLGELYRPGAKVVRDVVGLQGEKLGMVVRSSWYEDHKTIFGSTQTSFHLTCEFVASVGGAFAVCTFDDIVSDWTGPRRACELDYVPLSLDSLLFSSLTERGAVYGNLAIGNHFVECRGSGFLARHTRGHSVGRTAPTSEHQTARVMVDTQRGIQNSAFGIPDNDYHTLALLQSIKAYRQITQARDRESGLTSKPAQGQGLGRKCDQPNWWVQPEEGAPPEFFDSLPVSVRWCTWPTVLGFNFASKCWGHVMVQDVRAAHFEDTLLSSLVLAEDTKMLVRAFVAQQGHSLFKDVLAGKRGASVVLLHGPPGVGKTLTAEAMAENFHKPLYPVSMGELGENSREVEERLQVVLELCAAWDCIVLIDEADTILEKRTSHDIAKNSIVSVMLRLLEYHDGVVFLTTNRIQHFDPAVLSRVTISIAFTDLSPAERERVWHLLLSSSGVDESCIQVKQIAQRYDMNGRSIKNSLRLAMSLAADLRTPLSHDLLVRVIGAVLKGMRGAGEGHRAHGGGPGAPEGGHLAEDDAQRRKSQEVLEDQVSQRLRRLEVGAGCAVGMGACLAVAAGVAIGIGLGRAVGRGGSR